jgi:nitrate/TMAO reductase-like tetraheme cytochrome c subunit
MNSKNLFKVSTLLISLLFFITSCVKEGPMGLTGDPGLDGKNGTDGKDANATCLTCHVQTNMTAKEAQYEMSDKGERTARSGKYCARCHSTEGFEEITTMGTFFTTNEMLNGTKIGCAACHKHSGFDFGTDPIAKILRTTAPVYQSYENASVTQNSYTKIKATDFGADNNLCANCHQIRGSRVETYTDPTNPVKPVTTGVKYTEVPYFPIANVTGSITASTPVKFRAGTNFSIHEGANQPDYLISRGGYEYAGKTYTRKTAHSANTCTDCHFNAYDATTKTGGHTMKVNLKDPKCVSCHDLTTKIPTTLATINAKLAELGDLLATRKVFKKTASTSTSALNGFTYSALPSHDFYGTLLPTSASAPATYALTLTTTNLPSTTTGLLVYNNVVSWTADTDFANRIGREWTYGELGAAFNFAYVNTVATTANRGIHNTIYALELLQSSIDYLK